MKKLPTIDAILFDLMGVLLFQKPNYVPDPVVDEIDTLIGKVIDDTVFKRDMLKKFNLNETNFDAIISKIVDKYEAFTPLWEILPKLRKYYKLAIINNGTALTLPLFNAKLHFADYFDLFISSAREGITKPDQKIFLITAERLGIVPKRCLFMDDSRNNIAGATRIGMQTIWWTSSTTGFKNFNELIIKN